MSVRGLETDYLVIGSGAAGMAFADTLVTESDAQVVMVDRRNAPGGHWNDAYPFVRLHQPSLYYGVNSVPLGSEAINSSGPEAGMYERATGVEIRAYYFAADRITLQPVRTGLVPFNAALVAFVEARGGDDAEKNQLCPPNPFPDTILDWARGTLIQMQADRAWSRHADLMAWLERSRLNPTRGLRGRLADPQLQPASRRFGESVRPALVRLAELIARPVA